MFVNEPFIEFTEFKYIFST